MKKKVTLPILYLILVAMLLFTLSCISGGQSAKKKISKGKIDQPVQVGSLKIVVSDVSRKDSIMMAANPIPVKADGIFIIVDFSAENTSKSPREIKMSEAYLTDEQGTTYNYKHVETDYLTTTKNLADPGHASIKPKEKAKFELLFDVAPEAKKLKLYLPDTSSPESAVAEIDLGI